MLSQPCRLAFLLMRGDDGTFSGIYDEKTHYFSYQYCISPFFPLHLGDKQKRSLLCFRMGYSSSHASREYTGDADDGQMHFGCAVVHLHEPDNNSIESTQEGWGEDSWGYEAFASLQWRTLPPSHSVSQWEEQKKTRSQGQSPDTFPSNFHCQMCSFLALMACHFARAFGQELNLESKQIFRGAIFHQVLIFLHSRSLYSLI